MAAAGSPEPVVPVAAELTNPRADRVRRVAGLARRQVRRRTGRFLVEGPGPVGALLSAAASDPGATGGLDDGGTGAGAWDPPEVEVVYATVEVAADLAALATAAAVPVRTASPDVITAMSDAVTPQGVVAVARVVDLSLASLLARGPRTVAALARVRDPGNAGTVIRAADADGADGVVLTSGSVDSQAPKAVRASAGSLFHVPVATGIEVGEAVAACRSAGLTVLATSPTAATDLDTLLDEAGHRRGPLREPHAWLFGNEASGLRAEELAAADLAVAVPLRGRAESLNLAMAATVCLYASARARRPG